MFPRTCTRSRSITIQTGRTRSRRSRRSRTTFSVSRSADIREKFSFDHELIAADWDDAASRWMLTTTHGRISAKFVVSAVGALCEPNIPDIEGLGRFEGPVFHSAQWDHTVDLADKRVAVIGTGASAIQIVPAIASTVAHLDLFQRTAPWIFPRVAPQAQQASRGLPFAEFPVSPARFGRFSTCSARSTRSCSSSFPRPRWASA
ncbi:MAG: NAD(P)/FAD-dependent oxidoreductase [Rhodococcus sp. (in: high G+C Gram-positive bacteria)]|uniref:flavin-containing monooxygenase n=1 Tax=Rhodococcus sp. TaxID=1831 RepID=UPI002AD64E50|nr:NAD(P)/FAD-dependent oxidoreductase [Rhodococcus sp. (in: high G+C Gram-positive bacteria)]